MNHLNRTLMLLSMAEILVIIAIATVIVVVVRREIRATERWKALRVVLKFRMLRRAPKASPPAHNLNVEGQNQKNRQKHAA